MSDDTMYWAADVGERDADAEWLEELVGNAEYGVCNRLRRIAARLRTVPPREPFACAVCGTAGAYETYEICDACFALRAAPAQPETLRPLAEVMAELRAGQPAASPLDALCGICGEPKRRHRAGECPAQPLP